MLDDYRRARRLAQKELQADVAAGRYPYPPALDDILKGEGSQGEVPIGTTEIDISLIAGTRTRGRQNSFSSGFLPLPEPSSEFALKWSDLIDAQRSEGIRDPIMVYEFMQRFYVQEGNKRVSVMRYLGQPVILASIIRVVPMPSDSEGYRIYQEFSRFYQVAPLYGITFSREGGYKRLAALVDESLDKAWPQEKVQALKGIFDAVRTAFYDRGGDRLDMTVGDALVTYLTIFGFEAASKTISAEIKRQVANAWDEFVVKGGGGQVAYLEDPTAPKGAIVPELMNIYRSTIRTKPFRVAFIYESNPLIDGWTQLHERGRKKLENRLGATVATCVYPDCADEDDFALAVDDALAHNTELVVTVAPTQMTECLREAIAHPECTFINCSVSLSHSAVRTFMGRLYEAKFLLGALAASLSPNHRVGYVAETPVYGTVSEINAFAIGAQMIDPEVTVYLKWFSAIEYDWKRELAETEVSIVSARDYEDPSHPEEAWGLYRVEADGSCTHLAEPIWEWGRYYERIVRSIRNDTWQKEGSNRSGVALNYWWGMTAGVVDVSLSHDLPYGQRVLIEVLRQALLTRRLTPFAGELKSQNGVVQNEKARRLTSEEIVRMSWLNSNVVGRLPRQRELSLDGLEKVEVSGVIPLDPEKLPHKGLRV